MALEMQTSAAIAARYEAAEAEIRRAPVKNVDETGWRLGKARRWLWTAANSTAALFRISDSRGRDGLEALPGDRIRIEFEIELKLGCRSPDRKAARFCRKLLKIYPALWVCSRMKGVEPTNNHGERILRHGVMWRKTSFGNQSQGGATFTERILTVVQTARLQRLSPLEMAFAAIVDYRMARFD